MKYIVFESIDLFYGPEAEINYGKRIVKYELKDIFRISALRNSCYEVHFNDNHKEKLTYMTIRFEN